MLIIVRAYRPHPNSTPRWRPSAHDRYLPFLNTYEFAISLLTQTNTFESCLLLMSHTSAGPSSESLRSPCPNFQHIFDNALRAYKSQTKNDLLSHPLAAQLQACQSPNSILVVLQQQVQELNQSQISDHRLTKWLDPTINVLYAFSETIGEGVSLVRLMTWTSLTSELLFLLGRFSHPRR